MTRFPDGLVVENSLLAEIETQMQPAIGETKFNWKGFVNRRPPILTKNQNDWIQLIFLF